LAKPLKWIVKNAKKIDNYQRNIYILTDGFVEDVEGIFSLI